HGLPHLPELRGRVADPRGREVHVVHDGVGHGELLDPGVLWCAGLGQALFGTVATAGSRRAPSTVVGPWMGRRALTTLTVRPSKSGLPEADACAGGRASNGGGAATATLAGSAMRRKW